LGEKKVQGLKSKNWVVSEPEKPQPKKGNDRPGAIKQNKGRFKN